MSKDVIHTDAAPGPFQGAPYSQAVGANGFVFVAGQLGLAPGEPPRMLDGIAARMAALGASAGRPRAR